MEARKVVVDLKQLDQLEERITRAAGLIGTLRRERDAALGELAEARRALEALRGEVRGMEQDRQGAREAHAELEILREERQAVRGRVTRMLEMMAALEENATEARTDH
jgi:DNA repair exonuclease SbcCD ATPase subunit